MRIVLEYGERGLAVELPDERVSVIEPRCLPGVTDERQAVVDALRKPLAGSSLLETASLVGPTERVAIVFSDLTRPVPNRIILPPILADLGRAGIADESIVLINALGMHRPNTPDELVQMLGEEVMARYRVVNHDCSNPAVLTSLGRTSFGSEVWLNRAYVEASLRILTGFIEPHFFAGFSGGAKSLLPGIAGETTVLANHSSRMIGHPQATWGVTYGNPVFEDAREVARLAPPQFVVNVTTNRSKQVTGVFAGELVAAHDAGCEFARQVAMRPIEEPFDIVITTNSGYPLDLNVYQAVKGMSAAAQITRDGGAIIIASECREGLGQGHFTDILKLGDTPEALLEVIKSPGFLCPDQWEVQLLAEIRNRCRVFIYSDRLADEEARLAQLVPCTSVEAVLDDLLVEYGPEARVGVLPQGPMTIPYLASPAGADRGAHVAR